MKLSDVINDKWLDPDALKSTYSSARPFPHIVIHDFLKDDVLRGVADEFPDLSKLPNSTVKFENSREIKSWYWNGCTLAPGYSP
jgi:hypothetical protein